MIDPRAAVQVCNSYHPGELAEALAGCLQALDFSPPPGARVLIKPNAVTCNTPEQATGTHPAVLDALCAWLADSGCRLTVGDSSSYYFPGYTRRAFETLGLTEVIRRHGAAFMCFEEQAFLRVERANAPAACLPLYLADLSDFDLVINLPKLKVHRLTRISAAVKNMFGCVPGGTKQLYHEALKHRPDYLARFATLINDVYLHLRPGLNLLDAVVSLERDGPAANGDPRRTRFLLAARDGMVLDAALCQIVSESPAAVTTLKDAMERGLVDPKRVELIGRSPRVKFALLADRPPPGRLARSLSDLAMRQLMVQPSLDQKRCLACGHCAEQCQLGAIDIGRDERFNLERCIRCYACPSFCEQGAIGLSGSPWFAMMQASRRVLRM